MDQNLAMLLQAVALDDINNAKSYAEAFCKKFPDTMPPDFLNWLLPKFKAHDESEDKKKTLTLKDIPPEVSSLILFEDREELLRKFNPNRYWVSKREQSLFNDIDSNDKNSHILSQAGVPCSNTTLLYGNPGTGKTQFARYVAYMFKRPFIYVDLSQVFSSQMGETGKNLQLIFNFVQKVPCVFLMDELDTIGANRGSISRGGTADESVRTTMALTQCLDRVTEDVIILAATNRVDMLDAAVRRRFSIQHEIKPFTKEDRVNMIRSYLEDVKRDIKTQSEIDITWDMADIEQQCSEITMSQSELINICNRAIVRAINTRGEHKVKLIEESILLRGRKS